RGADWAEIRPEWGLAGAAAFVIAPRSSTSGLDLDGRAFLHEYDSSTDPDGAVLETIMTAPLIVAHWITSQYYFSTVDPEVFGAGDKLIHNPVGRIGVVSGDGGDLRVGLPLQSTHVDGRRHHQPLRLLAVVQADLETIERIIARHRILQNLVTGSWIRLAARSLPHEPWSIRTAAGTWLTHPRPVGTVTTMARQDLFPATGRGG
ncbi:MAG: putative inorganic carbon transporter subunit DabA, partial [Ilumatobacteraceae bacterium]